MRLLAALAVVLVASACGAKADQPAPGSTTPPPASPSPSAGRPAALDCAKPSSDAQRLVCNDQQLGDLDRRLQTAYQQALARPGADQAALGAAQASWAAARDACPQNTDLRSCVLEAYRTRLVQLAVADPATAQPPVVSYRCPAEDGPLTAQFYNQFDPPTAVLNWKGNQQILFQQPSGSGARYGRQGAEYWEHQGEVTLHLGGAEFVCHTS